MEMIGSRIEEWGTVFIEDGGLLFRREAGGRYRLEGAKPSKKLLGQRALLIGTLVEQSTVAAERLTLEA